MLHLRSTSACDFTVALSVYNFVIHVLCFIQGTLGVVNCMIIVCRSYSIHNETCSSEFESVTCIYLFDALQTNTAPMKTVISTLSLCTKYFAMCWALFSSKTFCKMNSLSLSFVFDKYCPIID